MGSGVVTGTTNYAGIVSRISWASDVVAGENASNVTVKFQLKGHSAGGGVAVYGTGYWTIRISGTDYPISLSIADGSVVTFDDKWRTYGTVTKKITHNADGTRSVPFRVTGGMSASVYTSTYLSGNFDLDKISQACTITAVSSVVTVNGSNALGITIARPSAVYYAVAKVALGSRAVSLAITGTTASYTIPAVWADQITSSSRAGTVTLTTYTDSGMDTQVGSADTATWTAVLPSASAPSVSDGWARVSPYNDSASGIPGNWGVAVAGRSRARVTFDASKISVSAGANIASYAIAYAGVTYGSPYTTDIIQTAGRISVVAKITDSRGYSTSQALTLEVLEYAAPTLSQVSLYRSNAQGAYSQAGGYIYALATVAYSSVGGNNGVTLQARYKAATATTWGAWTPLMSGTGILMGSGDLSPTMSYDAQIQAVDTIGSTTTYTESVSSDAVTFNLMDGGGGAAFGKFASKAQTLDTNWNIHTDKDIYAGGNATITGNLYAANFPQESVDKLTTPRKITLTGGANGSASFDGSSDVTINTTVSATPVNDTTFSGVLSLAKGGTGKSVATALALFQALGMDILIGSVAGVTTSTKSVTFARGMIGPPLVLVAQNGGTVSPAKITSVTASGFSISCGQSSSCSYRYMAIYWGV